MVLPLGYRGGMQRIEASTRLAAPPEDVFAFLANLDNLPVWMSGVTEATTSDGPMRAGSTVHVSRVLMGQHLAALLTVTAYEPPHRLELSTTVSGISVVAGLAVTPDGVKQSGTITAPTLARAQVDRSATCRVMLISVSVERSSSSSGRAMNRIPLSEGRVVREETAREASCSDGRNWSRGTRTRRRRPGRAVRRPAAGRGQQGVKSFSSTAE